MCFIFIKRDDFSLSDSSNHDRRTLFLLSYRVNSGLIKELINPSVVEPGLIFPLEFKFQGQCMFASQNRNRTLNRSSPDLHRGSVPPEDDGPSGRPEFCSLYQEASDLCLKSVLRGSVWAAGWPPARSLLSMYEPLADVAQMFGRPAAGGKLQLPAASRGHGFLNAARLSPASIPCCPHTHSRDTSNTPPWWFLEIWSTWRTYNYVSCLFRSLTSHLHPLVTVGDWRVILHRLGFVTHAPSPPLPSSSSCGKWLTPPGFATRTFSDPAEGGNDPPAGRRHPAHIPPTLLGSPH